VAPNPSPGGAPPPLLCSRQRARKVPFSATGSEVGGGSGGTLVVGAAAAVDWA